MHSATYAKGKRYGVLGYLPEPGSREAELWELNRTQSPFLRLPPEIRNKIYRLLLSNMGIHVLHDPKTGSFHCLTLRPGANPWTSVPAAVLGRGLTLLVLVCRQLYHETELIPYRENAWSWATPGLMERYLLTERRMGFAQRRVLREVCVRGIAGFGNCSRRVRGVLGGLEVVWFWEGGNAEQGKRGLGGWVCEVVERGRVEVGVGKPN
ncbi:uncharacterized protein CCOS01_11238 [Colletotrichum costaricense]|uniref:DUF7730 domain-containing protein n=1 Tax=Colletotrichum costaricense TaxID=1209916 RepID=A0AAI9YQI9_9PEZI|nr:uncharacterized protein CCOS01_11238 [Colletotrichum costaricense]KAK1519587.1 hypothetical protein CCOS01_11238 [Colletotrichum costaricense]